MIHAAFLPPQDKVIEFLDGLSDDALKKEATTEARSDTFSSIMKVRGERERGGRGRRGRGEREGGREGRQGEQGGSLREGGKEGGGRVGGGDGQGEGGEGGLCNKALKKDTTTETLLHYNG